MTGSTRGKASLAAIAVWLAGFSVLAADCPLVRDGVATSRIVLAANASAVEAHAAAELVGYLERVTGARVPVGTTPDQKLSTVYLGTTAAAAGPRSRAVDKAVARLTGDGFVIAVDKGGVQVLSHEPAGVLYGAYYLLKAYAGVRWFYPGADGEHCPRQPSVAVPRQVTVHNPAFAYRELGFICANVNSRTVDTWDWMARNGLTIQPSKHIYREIQAEFEKRGARTYDGGHCFSYLLPDRLFNQHPDYFPLIDGKRVPQEWRHQPCTSNPTVAGIMATGIGEVLNALPPGGRFLMGNNDSTSWCQCENCARLDPPDEKQKGLVSTRYCTFVNQVAAKVWAIHPGAELWAWAYQNYRLPPSGVVLDRRLPVEACVHHRCYRHSLADADCLANAMFREMLSGWRKLGHVVITREYNECLPGEPSYVPYERIFWADLRYYHRLGLSGFRIPIPPPDGTFGPTWNNRRTLNEWYAQWQALYLAALQAWDIDADYTEAVEDMGSKYYGPAWATMKPYRELLVQTYEATPGHILYGTPDMTMGKCLERPGVQVHLNRLLAAAETAAAGDELVLRRVQRDRDYFASCWEATYREYLAKRPREACAGQRTGRITIDGRFEEEDWQRVDFTTDFIVNDGKTRAEPQTYVKALYDRDNLYLTVDAMEPEPAKLQSACATPDGPGMWGDSTVEFFIALPGTGGQYYQIAVNPKGTLYDALNSPSQAAELSFDAKAEVRTAVLADRWTVEARIPAAAFGRTLEAGETWKVNVGRNRKLADGTPAQASSWSNGAFHGPEAYRPLVFGDTALVRNGDFEASRPLTSHEKEYFAKTAWRIDGETVPDHWTFNGEKGAAAVLDTDAASGRRFLRLTGAVYARVNQAAEYRADLLIRASVRGQGHLAICLYRYQRDTDKHESSVVLKEADVASAAWTTVETRYACRDDRVLRVAFHTQGVVDLDDVSVVREPSREGPATLDGVR